MTTLERAERPFVLTFIGSLTLLMAGCATPLYMVQIGPPAPLRVVDNAKESKKVYDQILKVLEAEGYDIVSEDGVTVRAHKPKPPVAEYDEIVVWLDRHPTHQETL